MKTPLEKLFAKAEDSLSDAEFLFENSRYSGAVNRAYYTAFYCISAFLEEKDIYPKTHKGAHMQFHHLYVRTGIVDPLLGDALKRLFDVRQSTDYNLLADVSQEEALQTLDYARAFLAATKVYFAQQP